MKRCIWNILIVFAYLLPSVVPGNEPNAPATVNELFVDFDPRKDPLDAKLVREWEKGGIVFRHITFHVGTFFEQCDAVVKKLKLGM